MRILRILVPLSVLSLAGILSSCEEILDAEGLPYEEKLVIHCILMGDSGSAYVDISRTLPLNVPFDTAQSFIKDAKATISDGTTTYELIYSGWQSRYLAKSWAPREGVTYVLDVSWHDLHAQASTIIPTGGSIDTAWLENGKTEWGGAFRQLVTVATLPDGCSMQLEYFARSRDTFDFPSWGTGDETFHKKDLNGKTIGRLDITSDLGVAFKDFTATSYIFAPGYYQYRESRELEIDENLGNPVLVKWNVTGDAIGIFFGCKRIDYEVI